MMYWLKVSIWSVIVWLCSVMLIYFMPRRGCVTQNCYESINFPFSFLTACAVIFWSVLVLYSLCISGCFAMKIATCNCGS